MWAYVYVYMYVGICLCAFVCGHMYVGTRVCANVCERDSSQKKLLLNNSNKLPCYWHECKILSARYSIRKTAAIAEIV